MKHYSVSAIKTFNQCPQKYDWKYNKLQLPDVKFDNMRLGSAVHFVIAEVLRQVRWGGTTSAHIDTWCEDAVQLWRHNNQLFASVNIDGDIVEDVSFNDFVDKLYGIVVSFFNEMDFVTRYEVLGHPKTGSPLVEFLIEDTIHDIPVKGFVDAIIYDHFEERTIIADWKTRASFADYSQEMLDMQLPMYYVWCYALGLAPDVVTLATVQIKNTPPKRPTPIKSGAMSRANISTTWDIYRKELLRYNLDPEDYLDMQEKLQGNTFVEVVDRVMSINTARAYETPFVYAVDAIEALDDEDWRWTRKVLNYTCNYCPFQDLCISDLTGGDTEYLLKLKEIQNAKLC